MKLFVAAKPGSKFNRVEKIDSDHFRVHLKEPAEDGRANDALLEILADYFGCPRFRLSLLSGHRSRRKIIGFREN